MEEIQSRLADLFRFSSESWIQLVDIALVAFLIYRVLLIIRNTRAWRIFVGIVIFVLALFLSDFWQLRTLHWMLDKATALGPVALVILLLPELRQALEGVSKLGLWSNRFTQPAGILSIRSVEELVASVAEMSASRIGALIVIERQTRLDDIANNGVMIDARISSSLLTSIFYDGNPLHDGALILRGDKILAGACQLPLSENDNIARHYHMRHRAAIGIAEQTDAIAVVVSEERGTIGVAQSGRLKIYSTPHDFRAALMVDLGIHKPDNKKRRAKKESGVA